MKQIKLAQIAPVLVDDGIGITLQLYAVDTAGALWQRLGRADNWQRVENPPASSSTYPNDVLREQLPA